MIILMVYNFYSKFIMLLTEYKKKSKFITNDYYFYYIDDDEIYNNPGLHPFKKIKMN